jgi:hypothetical protein
MQKGIQQNQADTTRDTGQNEDQKRNPDKRMDQDFPGFPDHPAKEKIIRPETPEQKKVADIHEKDGEKRNYPENDRDEEESDGSANAFERTESVKDEE